VKFAMLFKFMWNISCNSLGVKSSPPRNPIWASMGICQSTRVIFFLLGFYNSLTPSSAYLTSQD
jgi:hypothetical protein